MAPAHGVLRRVLLGRETRVRHKGEGEERGRREDRRGGRERWWREAEDCIPEGDNGGRKESGLASERGEEHEKGVGGASQ
jgi:hypothetical protein